MTARYTANSSFLSDCGRWGIGFVLVVAAAARCISEPESHLLEQYALIRTWAIQAWQGLPTNQKVILLLMQCVGLFGTFVLLLV
ncbi:hypothetical protein [Methyloglobulus sp.]|uniref:hypothetical protein n=1 Tax=Methyloglobulus sp. TaxID=2518622 RepID=UPI00398952D8